VREAGDCHAGMVRQRTGGPGALIHSREGNTGFRDAVGDPLSLALPLLSCLQSPYLSLELQCPVTDRGAGCH
jgi:hypothetical protein